MWCTTHRFPTMVPFEYAHFSPCLHQTLFGRLWSSGPEIWCLIYVFILWKRVRKLIFFLLHCSRLLITLLNGSYLKDDDCLLCWGQLSNLPQGAEKMQVASLADPSPRLPQGAKLVHSVPCSPEAGAALMMVWPAEISQYALSSVLLE